MIGCAIFVSLTKIIENEEVKKESGARLIRMIPLQLILIATVTVVYFGKDYLTLKAPNKNCSRRHFNFLLLSFEEN